MNAKLYHTEIGMPENLLAPFTRQGAFVLFYSRHAKSAALDDGFAQARQMPLELAILREEIFEAEVINGRVTKLCVRLSRGFTASRPDVDLILVLMPMEQRDGLFVKTCWFNERNDTHATLDHSKYAQPLSR